MSGQGGTAMATVQIVRKNDYALIKSLAPGESAVIVAHVHGKAPVIEVMAGNRTKPIECRVEYLETRLEMKKSKTSTTRIRVTRR